jgi:hypothetical protein
MAVLEHENKKCLSTATGRVTSDQSSQLLNRSNDKKTGKMYCLEHTDLLKTFFRLHRVGHCCNNAISNSFRTLTWVPTVAQY